MNSPNFTTDLRHRASLSVRHLLEEQRKMGVTLTFLPAPPRAARAADDALRRQRDTLLRLISEAN